MVSPDTSIRSDDCINCQMEYTDALYQCRIFLAESGDCHLNTLDDYRNYLCDRGGQFRFGDKYHRKYRENIYSFGIGDAGHGAAFGDSPGQKSCGGLNIRECFNFILVLKWKNMNNKTVDAKDENI